MMTWGRQPIESLCDVFADGDWIETKDQSEEGIRLIQTGNIGEGQFKNRLDKARYISEQTFEQLNCFEVLPGDCLVSRLPDPVGRACVIPDIESRAITSVDCTIIRFKSDTIYPEFFKYYSMSLSYLNDVDQQTSGATRKRISRKNLGKVKVPVPSMPEQKRIVAMLDEAFADIDKTRELTEQNLKNARELFESYLKAKLKPSGENRWITKKFGEICTLQRGFDLPKSARKDGSKALVSSSGILERVSHAKVEGPGVITGRSGSIGKVFFLDEDFWPLNTTLYVKNFYENNERFIYWLLRSFDLGRFASGAGVPTLNRHIVHDELVTIPVYSDVQVQIADEIQSIEQKIIEVVDKYSRKLLLLDNLKKTLIEKAFADIS